MSRAGPALQLETLFARDARGRIVSTCEPGAEPGPAFVLIRGEFECAWAARADVADPVAIELDRLAAGEPPSRDWDRPLRHADRYVELLRGRLRSGPAFVFPERLEDASGAIEIHDEAELSRHFSGWVAGEIADGRGPVLGIRDGDDVVSVCFCARRSGVAAEAGVETAAAFRGRGYAPLATTAWARRVRALGLTPLYSTEWTNRASLSVARRLRLVPFAADFSVDR